MKLRPGFLAFQVNSYRLARQKKFCLMLVYYWPIPHIFRALQSMRFPFIFHVISAQNWLLLILKFDNLLQLTLGQFLQFKDYIVLRIFAAENVIHLLHRRLVFVYLSMQLFILLN